MVLNFVREMRNRLAHLTRGICEAVRGICSHGGDMSVHSLEGEQGYFAVIVMCDWQPVKGSQGGGWCSHVSDVSVLFWNVLPFSESLFGRSSWRSSQHQLWLGQGEVWSMTLRWWKGIWQMLLMWFLKDRDVYDCTLTFVTTDDRVMGTSARWWEGVVCRVTVVLMRSSPGGFLLCCCFVEDSYLSSKLWSLHSPLSHLPTTPSPTILPYKHPSYALIVCWTSWHLMYALIVCSTSWHLT